MPGMNTADTGKTLPLWKVQFPGEERLNTHINAYINHSMCSGGTKTESGGCKTYLALGDPERDVSH